MTTIKCQSDHEFALVLKALEEKVQGDLEAAKRVEAAHPVVAEAMRRQAAEITAILEREG